MKLHLGGWHGIQCTVCMGDVRPASSNPIVLVRQVTHHAVPCMLWLFIVAAAGAAAAPVYPNSSCSIGHDAQVQTSH